MLVLLCKLGINLMSVKNVEEQSAIVEDSISETQVFLDIVTWSTDCPEWQRDALRRLCSKDQLEQDDIDSLLSICKNEQEGSPITTDHIRDPAASDVALSLSKLHNLQNVNALKSGEILTFNSIRQFFSFRSPAIIF
jgi:hypothetical protein